MTDSRFKETGTFKLLILVVIAWIVLAIIFGFTDLQISQAVILEINQGWGNFGADYGEAPGYGFIAIGVVILVGCGTTNIKKQKIFALILGIIGIGIMINGIIEESQSTINVGGSIGIAVLLFTLIFYNKDWSAYKSIAAVIVLLAVFNPLLFVQITKIFCGRIRFRDLVATDFIGYTPWFSPPGLASGLEGNASFPSGHTSMGWMFLPLIIVVKDRKKTDPIKILAYIWAIGWGIFVGISRVVVGAHFASDVLFATGMAWVVTIFLYYMYYYRKRSEKIKKTIKVEKPKVKQQVLSIQPRISHVEEKTEKIKKILKVSNKIKLEMIRNALEMDQKSFDGKIFDWSDEFGFIIDGDFIIINKDGVSDFINALDKKFLEWEKDKEKI